MKGAADRHSTAQHTQLTLDSLKLTQLTLMPFCPHHSIAFSGSSRTLGRSEGEENTKHTLTLQWLPISIRIRHRYRRIARTHARTHAQGWRLEGHAFLQRQSGTTELSLLEQSVVVCASTASTSLNLKKMQPTRLSKRGKREERKEK